MPETLRVASPQGLWIPKGARDKTLVICAALEFPQGSTAWSILFPTASAGHEQAEPGLIAMRQTTTLNATPTLHASP